MGNVSSKPDDDASLYLRDQNRCASQLLTAFATMRYTDLGLQ
jgi:hypothetical protein